jgi:tetratricopeptide (TPR) repeat protein
VYPADFWVNWRLGEALSYSPVEAIPYRRAALAVRPGESEVCNDLASALFNTGRLGEANDLFRRALEIDPKNVMARGNLIAVLKIQGRLDEVVELTRETMAFGPRNQTARKALLCLLVQAGRGEEARVSWRKELETDPPDHDAWFGYAELCQFLGQDDKYRRARQDLLRRFGASEDPAVAERVGRACVLSPASDDDLRKAVALVDRAAAAGEAKGDASLPYYLFAKGLADYRLGRLHSAIALMRGEASTVMGPAPGLILAMALHREGKKDEASKTLAAAILPYDWRLARTENWNGWIFHILRREAEGLILPDLPAFLHGTHQPRDNDERVALLGTCQFNGLHLAAARLYADAFAADPKLAEDLMAGIRYRGACAAALAARGNAAGGAQLSEAERARWRDQARRWLRADLALWAKKVASGQDRRRVLPMLVTTWGPDPDLAGIRDQDALDEMPRAEREECRMLWSDFDALLNRALRFHY